MKPFFTLLILLVCLNVSAQKELNSKYIVENYSPYNSTCEERNEYYFGLTPIEDSKNKYHFRYNTLGQVVDLYSKDGSQFESSIINYAFEVKDSSSYDYKRYVFNKVNIPVSTSNKLGEFILENETYLIPTDSLIKNWNGRWADCGNINLSYKVNSDFYAKKYKCLLGQSDTIAEVKELEKFISFIYKTLNIDKVYRKFFF